MTALLQVDNVTKAFGGVVANNKVSLRVAEGQIVGLIGPNGSGKTTLFNSIVGFHPIDDGAVAFAGREISRLRVPNIARLGLLRTFQQTRIYGRMSCVENMLISVPQRETEWAALFRKPGRKARARADERAGDDLVGGGADHPQAEGAHGQALEQRRPGARAQAHGQHEQGDGVVRRIAEEVQRVGLQRDRAGNETGHRLDDEHRGVDGQRQPQDAAVARVRRGRAVGVVRALAAAGHSGLLADMGDHVGDDAADVVVRRRIVDLLAVALTAQHAGRAQQPQVMAHQRRRQVEPVGDVADAGRRLEAGQDDAQAAAVAHQAEHVGQLGRLIFAQPGQGRVSLEVR